MKDYSLNANNAGHFILNYRIEDNQIIIKLASGEEYLIPYSDENEEKILERMKEQVRDSHNSQVKQEKRFSKAKCIFLINSVVLWGNVMLMIMLSSIPNVVLSVISGFVAALEVYEMVDSKQKIKDMRKNSLFLQNETKLNEKVRSNPNILSKTSTKTKKMVSSVPQDRPALTINDMDGISIGELQRILDNIRRDEIFGFDYSSQSDSVPYTRKREK